MKKKKLIIISMAAIVAIIALIALFSSIRCFDCSPGSSKKSITRITLKSLSMDIYEFYLTKLRLPDNIEEISSYTLDSWGNPIIYQKISDTSYIIGSHGADGKRGGSGVDADISLNIDTAKYNINQN